MVILVVESLERQSWNSNGSMIVLMLHRILIAANVLGLGAVWQGVSPRGGEDSDRIGNVSL